MRAIRRRDTLPELRLRSALHRDGLRFRVDYPLRFESSRPVRPDVVFTRWRLAVFVDGCYWHGCPEHGVRQGGKNAGYWSPKIARNVERDADQAALLERHGWRVLRFWEHDGPEEAAAAVADAIEEARSQQR